MPFRMVWPDSWSVETRKDGSSATSLASATPSFSWSALDFGSIGHLDDRLRELHALEDHGLVQIAERVARAGILQAGHRDDVAGVGLLDVLAVVRVHQKHAADPLRLVLASSSATVVPDFDRAGIDAAEGDRADEGVVHDLEGEQRERLVVGGSANASLPRS